MATGTAVDVVMPQMGVSVSEGTITKWLKAEGDPIAADEPLLEISTDKVDTEVPSPASGVVARILAQEGETVPVGTVIAVLSPEGTATGPGLPEPPATMVAASESGGASSAETGPPPLITETVAEQAPRDEPGEANGNEGRAFVSPVVARIAAEHGVDVGAIEGTGRGGRVTKKDILDHLDRSGAGAATPAPPAPPKAPSAPPAPPAPAAPAEPGEGEVLEPLSVMRKAIAEHMMRSVQTSAHVTTLFEIDMSKVVAIRSRLKREYEERHGVRLTYLPFICRAVVACLEAWPRLNAELRGDQMVLKRHVNLGVAVALDDGKGLIVPVVHHAEEKNLLGIARAIADLAERARTKKLLPDDVQGGTFTITNPGGFGAVAGTPIINQPQVGIVDVEAIVKRVVVVSGDDGTDSIAIRPMMNLALTYDHRLVDGAYAAPFMRDVKVALETWEEDAY